MPELPSWIPDWIKEINLWELTSIFLSAIQMLYYLNMMDDYLEKLAGKEDQPDNENKSLAWILGDPKNDNALALKHARKYKQMRDLDPSFKKWYDDVPRYEVCKSGIHRGKGRVYQEFGGSMRKLLRMNNGYTPLAMVGAVSSSAMGITKATGSVRALNHNAEEGRRMSDALLHWKKIVSIPVEREGDHGYFTPVIKGWMTELQNAGQGFNSAGAAFGSSLYNFLHSTNQTRQNYGAIPTNTTSSGQQAITIGWPNNVARRP